MRKRTQAREYALQLLYQLDITGEELRTSFDAYWKVHSSPQDVREFTERIVSGTLQHREQIDNILVRYVENWNLDRMAIIDRNILRFSTYELLFMEDIPPKVSINEAVNLAKRYSQENSGKFVNGVLDKVCHSETNKATTSE